MLAVLDSADKIGYELKHNDLWTGSFSLPAGDAKNAFCQAHNLVRLPDGTRDTGLFRIVGMPSSEETAMGGVRTYSLEHVMATLLDDVLFGYHEVGGTGVSTRDVMQYILDRQTVQRWQLGVCEFNDYFQYHFENVSLLSALLSLGEVLTEEYTWEFDTDTTPWTVNLRQADQTPGCGIHYGRNLVSIQKTMDASALVTRLYPLGYGEGVNQLTIREANGGVPYIDADTAAVWGVKCSVWTDTRIQDAATLKARGLQVLDGYKNPYITYTARAIDLFLITGFSWDDYMPGKLVKVMDSEHGIDFDARIVSISKRDVNGDPGDIEITIANTPRDAADSINTLADRVGIGELYSQGATNLFAIPFADNADENHPAKFRVYIPAGMVRINKMLLSWQLQSFRAYSTGAAAGGSTTRTSSGGGGGAPTTSVSDTVTYTSEDGGGCQVTSSQRIVSKSADGGDELIGWTFGPRDNSASGDGEVMTNTKASADTLMTGKAGGHHHGMGHTHNIDAHHHGMDHYHTVNGHRHTVDSHTHGMAHHHTVSSHKHTVDSHNHSIGSHDHSFSGSDTVYWQHWHDLSGGDTVHTGNVSENIYVPKSVSISGTTGSSSGSTGSTSPDTSSASPDTGQPINFGSTISDTGAASPGTSSASPDTTGAKQSGSDRNNTGDTALTTGGARAQDALRPNTDDEPDHQHALTAHGHGMDHFHRLASFTIPPLEIEIPAHGHNVSIPGHSHTVELPTHTHDVTLPDHTHGIVYGIYEGGRASNVTIRVDGTDVPAGEISSSEIDVSGYLSKDDNGKIRRGAWHEIQIVPDGLTRIEANLTAQVFVQSVGGGDY